MNTGLCSSFAALHASAASAGDCKRPLASASVLRRLHASAGDCARSLIGHPPQFQKSIFTRGGTNQVSAFPVGGADWATMAAQQRLEG